jgi:hypothetical protein
MSKLTLKKHLQTLSKEQVIETVLNMYDAVKPAKEYLEYFLNPDEKAMYEKYKKVITDEFYPRTMIFYPKLRFSVARKAIAEFRALKPSPELLADLMFTLAENACQFTYEYGDMPEGYYNSAYSNMAAALKYIKQQNLLDNFKLRCLDCEKWASRCGYGFADEISQLVCDYYEV